MTKEEDQTPAEDQDAPEEGKKKESALKKKALGLFKSKVRSRKSGLVAIQKSLPIAEIRNDTIFLKDGGMRAVIAVEAINFNLKSEMEQEGIIAAYGAFVNTLTFPLQIVVRSLKTNIDPYLENLEAIGKAQKNQLLKNQTLTYARFLREILAAADIMQKQFYVVVPYDQLGAQPSATTSIFSRMFTSIGKSATSAGVINTRSPSYQTFNAQLRERVELIEAGLNNVGLHTRRLKTQDLIELFYQIYNPDLSTIQKMPKNFNLLNIENDVV
jgi:uncharacterized membrane protein